jgi:ABC-2 type transport system permease protein
MRHSVAFWSIIGKDMKAYYLKPPNISWGIIFPFSWMLMMLIRSKSAFDIQEIFAGLVSMSIMFGTTSMLSVTITFERKSRSFERLLVAPIPIELMVVAKIAGAILFGIFNSLVPIAVATIGFGAPVASWPTLLAGAALLSIVSTLLGLFIAVSANEVFEAQTYSNFFRFPMIFLCGLYIPIRSLPAFLRPLSYAIPITYGVDAIRGATTGGAMLAPALSLAILAASGVFLFFLSIRNIRRKWIV